MGLLWLMLAAASSQALTVLYRVPSAAVYVGLPFNNLEFDNPLNGTEMVLSHRVLEWRDADYTNQPEPWYDDWVVSHPGGIDGNANEIWMRANGHSISTATTVASKIISIHLVGDNNDGVAQVLVDGVEVARLHMYATTAQTALVVVSGLASTTHTITVNDLGPLAGTPSGPDVATLGVAALAESEVKWDQPPLPADPTNVFYGWNEISMYGFGSIAADDWACTTTDPVTDLHWWGSFPDWPYADPPQLPPAFNITIWTDVPADPTGNFSHPGVAIWQIYCTNYTWKFVGWDYDPIKRIYEACFRFDQNLLPHEWFYQDPNPTGTGTNIYWISIAAVYPTVPQYPWGWKTRPRDLNSPAPDDAVRIFDPVAPIPGSQFFTGDPIWWPEPTNSWDLAFELTTLSEGETAKWHQVPDLTPEGMDVHASENLVAPPPYLLADDFLCTTPGPITNITIWGSWLDDVDWQSVVFTLSIHDDILAS